jgi:methionyl-tRNA formyltransferase
MIPAELESNTIVLPDSDVFPIVAFTGSELRHDRFALRLQSELPGLVVAWFQVVPAVSADALAKSNVDRLRKVYARLSALMAGGNKLFTSTIGRQVIAARIRKITSDVATRTRARLRRNVNAQKNAEQRLFAEELKQLRTTAYISPKTIQNPNAPEIIQLVKSFDPYFILTLGGGIYGKELRACARGLALNQHDGWCPEYRGANTVNWAMYHRDLSKVANTVHVLTEGMDSGPILRRSIACLADDDNLESAFARSVALGTELMCETVRELITTKQARIFPQPQFAGRTYLFQQMNVDMRRDLEMDLRRNFIARDLGHRKAF